MSALPQGLKPISFHPDDMVAGGFLNDVDVEIESAIFTTEPPPEYGEAGMFCKMSLKELHSGDITEQWLSCGKVALDNFTVGAEGRILLPSGGRSGLVKTSKFGIFMESLAGKGFPRPLCQDMQNMVGLQFHVMQIPSKAPGAGMSAAKSDKQRTDMVCDRIIKLPGEKAKRGAKTTPAAASAPTPAAASAPTPAAVSDNGDYATMALEQITAALVANSNTLPIKVVRAKVYGSMKSAPTDTRNAVVKLVTDPAWLESQGLLVDDANVTLVVTE